MSVALGVGGILLAWTMWGRGRVYPLPTSNAARSVRTLLLRRYFFKAGYDWIGAKGVYTVARAADFFDQYVIDGTVHGFERAFAALSNRMRRLQTGLVSDYASYVVAGLVALFVLLLLVAPYLVGRFGGP